MKTYRSVPAGRNGRAAREGMVLFAVLATFSALALLAATVFLVTRADTAMAGHFRRSVEALHAADAGVQYVKGRIVADLVSGALVLDNAVETVNYQPPTGMRFDAVTGLARLGDSDRYAYEVTGRSANGRAIVQATFRQLSVFEIGVFGDVSMEGKASGHVYLYDSGMVANPVAGDSLGGATVGSNGTVTTHQDTYFDGSILLGAGTSGTAGVWSELPSGGSTVVEGSSSAGARIAPDPLGAVGGNLAADFITYRASANNNNASAIPPISGNRIQLKNGEAMTLRAGVYYVTDIDLANGSTLTVDASAGPVTIYLSGMMYARNGSRINTTGNPADLTIFSNSSKTINLANSGSFKGVVYAPYAFIDVNNSADFYGVCWGNSVNIRNSGDVFIDARAQRRYLTRNIRIVTWKERRG